MIAMQLTIIVSQLNCLFEPTFSNLQYHFMFYWILGAYFGSVWQPADMAVGSAPLEAPGSAVPAQRRSPAAALSLAAPGVEPG